ncbi:alpha/beta family hydrolase [Modicisalibacter muralis]|uniref:alpha/beta family hydrolase n=1 Tax=Modicisalibacter muralis TaxID=119000 RepID=UPI000B7F7C64|nr:alpha/beta family hydrolase [Halomonas muralis]
MTPQQLRTALQEPGDAKLFIEGIGPLEKRGEARKGRLLIAHGAGAGQDSTFMRLLRQALSENGVQTLAIEFAYMQRMREENRRRPPPKIDGLIEEMARWCDVVSQPNSPALWLGGKSLGGRVASMLAARDGAAGLALCGYPFHPPGKPDKTRLAHWPAIACPTLVMQGTRDPFGTRDEVEGYDLPASVSVRFLEDGDHDWKPRRISGRDQADLIAEGAAGIAATMAASR